MVGPQLMNPETHAIHHAGIVFNRDGELAYIFAGESEHAYGVFGGPSWCRNWSAVSGACFAIRREVFDQVGGFAENPRYPRLDIDLCLRVTVQHGWRIFYNSYAQFHAGGADPAGAMGTASRRTPPAIMRAAVFPWAIPSSIPGSNAATGKSRSTSETMRRSRVIDYTAEARALASGFDFSPAALTESRALPRSIVRLPKRRAAWPGFCRNSPILFMAGSIPSCARPIIASGRTRCSPLLSLPCPEVVIRSAIRAAFPALARSVRISGVHQLLPVAVAARIVTPPSRRSGPPLTRCCGFRMRGGSSTSCRITNRGFILRDRSAPWWKPLTISVSPRSAIPFRCGIFTRGSAGRRSISIPVSIPAIFHAKNRAPRPRGEPLTLVLLRPAVASPEQF